jgi:hypothetical protein
LVQTASWQFPRTWTPLQATHRACAWGCEQLVAAMCAIAASLRGSLVCLLTWLSQLPLAALQCLRRLFLRQVDRVSVAASDSFSNVFQLIRGGVSRSLSALGGLVGKLMGSQARALSALGALGTWAWTSFVDAARRMVARVLCWTKAACWIACWTGAGVLLVAALWLWKVSLSSV